VKVVPATRAHVDALMPYENDMFGTEAWSRSAYLAEIADTRHRHYVAAESDDGELLGWAGIRVLADEAEILTVGVVPALRRQGIARLLVADLLEHARAHGAVVAFLEVRVDNLAARALYESEGFEQIGLRRGYYDGGRVDAVTMRRMIDS
jgi:ribosomal-protein-alanine N-acetyltransferase